VTVIPPGSPSPGNDTPADVLTGVVAAITAKNYTGICQYFQPSSQSSCRSAMAQLTPANASGAFKNFSTIKATWTAIDGDQALVGETGTVCDQSTNKCNTNSDPAAVFDSGKTFSQIWQAAVNSTSSAYEPAPLVRVNGKWYGQATF
jgi:hypothetical protein